MMERGQAFPVDWKDPAMLEIRRVSFKSDTHLAPG